MCHVLHYKVTPPPPTLRLLPSGVLLPLPEASSPCLHSPGLPRLRQCGLCPLPCAARPPSSLLRDAWCNEHFWTKDNRDLLHDTELTIIFTASKYYWESKFLLSSLKIFDRSYIRILTEKTCPEPIIRGETLPVET